MIGALYISISFNASGSHTLELQGNGLWPHLLGYNAGVRVALLSVDLGRGLQRHTKLAQKVKVPLSSRVVEVPLSSALVQHPCLVGSLQLAAHSGGLQQGQY